MECSFSECSKKHFCKGLCSAHYQQLHRGQELRPLRVYGPPKTCSLEGCDKPHSSKGLCNAHRAAKWVKDNPERHRANLQTRRGRLKQAGKMDPDAFPRLVELYGTCLYPGCGATDKLQIDHVVPLSRGGSNEFGNLQLLCKYHNQSKGAQSSDFR